MKNIKILMSQCDCNIAFAESVEKIVKESGLEASVSRIDDVVQMLPYNVMTLPALVVDERLVSTGKISEDKIKELIKGEI
ncbi:Thioredoxin domain-containing protein [Fibrobacter sp. UWB16]|uniref:thioredoxin family protein n=1 Tax=Fibrobacter sp. UWB16 TaxID=1945874 RepID=UPI000BCA06CE|nr:thioredoxin family protein [Fibrobacter sp. UWB16]SOD15848.1 Thioredoxin domain-containing protein [Fibrobacter sp. UWB16]